MDFATTLEYLYSRLPMFQRVGAAAYKANLDNITALCAVMGHPEKQFKSIHIAGTNGKGSTSHTIAAVLQAAGLKTGLYTSPHLKRFTERIRLNGQEIPENEVVTFVEKYKDLIERLNPSFFEITVAMAFSFFAQEKVDIAVIEVGMGGRLDATNVIRPIVSTITNIGWDHTEFLGDTLPKIAREKAGIIKQGVPIVISEYQAETWPVFLKVATENRTTPYVASASCTIKRDTQTSYAVFRNHSTFLTGLRPDLQGPHQLKNLVGALATLWTWERQTGKKLPTEAYREGIENVTRLTGLKGRWQVLQQSPKVVCDVGHNVNGWQVVRNMIAKESFEKLHLILGVVKDKDPAKLLDSLPKADHYYFCQPSIPRGLAAQELGELAAQMGKPGLVIPDVNAALQAALAQAGANDLIVVGGSSFVVADLAQI